MSVAICSLRLRPVCSLRARVADLFGEFELDEVVDVFGLWCGLRRRMFVESHRR